MSSPLDEFHKNFPLTFLRRDPSKQQLTNFPSCINEARDQILRKSWNHANSEESELGLFATYQLYLYATGNIGYQKNLNNDPEINIRSLIKTHRISESSCGLVSDIDIKQRHEIIKLPQNVDLNNVSFHEILRFCFAHGMYVGHDIETEELKSMARWIIQNEKDGVTFSKFATLMQQAIDMSVLAQYADKLGPENDEKSRNRLNHVSKEGLSMTSQIESQNSKILHESGLLLNISSEISERKPISDFQSKVLHSHIDSQMQIEEKIEKGHTSSSSNSQLNSQTQDENANNSSKQGNENS